MREKIVLIGAGSAVFTKGMLADLINRNWDCRLALVDIDAEALAVAEGLAKKMIEVLRERSVILSLRARECLAYAAAMVALRCMRARRP